MRCAHANSDKLKINWNRCLCIRLWSAVAFVGRRFVFQKKKFAWHSVATVAKVERIQRSRRIDGMIDLNPIKREKESRMVISKNRWISQVHNFHSIYIPNAIHFCYFTKSSDMVIMKCSFYAQIFMDSAVIFVQLCCLKCTLQRWVKLLKVSYSTLWTVLALFITALRIRFILLVNSNFICISPNIHNKILRILCILKEYVPISKWKNELNMFIGKHPR